jgi:hypothetical protein
VSYVLDPLNEFAARCNMAQVELQEVRQPM